jgi:hypothetical protein
VRARGRKIIALVASAVAHLGVLAYSEVVPHPDLANLELDLEFDLQEVELLDPDAIQGVEGTPEASPPQMPEAPPETPPEPTEDELKEQEDAEKKRKDEEEAERKKKEEEERKKKEAEADAKKFAKRGSEADELAPPQSTLYMFLVPKAIRKLPFADKAVDMLAPWPDFELLVSKGGFDALRDFDHMVIASANIRDWRQTFLAVYYKMSREDLKAGIERAVKNNGETIEWIEDGEVIRGNPKPTAEGEPDVDNRWFVLLPDNLAVYVHDKFLPHVLEGPTGEEKTAGNFVANLTRMKKYAARQPGSGLQLMATDIQRAFKLRRGIEGLPLDKLDGFEVSVEASTEPEMVIRATFVDVASAKLAETFWKETFKGIIDAKLSLKFVVGPIYDQTTVERDREKLVLRGEFTEEQITQVLDMIAKSSAKMTKKTPEEVEEMRRQRLENWKKRNGGKLPPSALGETASPDAPPEAPAEPGPT